MNEPKAIKLYDVRIERQIQPLGIDCPNPLISWKISSSQDSVYQTGYQIIVSTTADMSPTDSELIWNSGRREGSKSFDIKYDGPKLESRARYFVSIRVETNKGTSDWSEPTWWEMGLLNLLDWKAKWILPNQEPRLPDKISLSDYGDGSHAASKFDQSQMRPAEYVRKVFGLRNAPIKRARVYATAHGCYSLSINGQRASDSEFTPEWTNYSKLLMYQTFDVSDLLTPGSNVMNITLADGWYAGRLGFLTTPIVYGDKLECLVQIEIEYLDGSLQTIGSDETFKSSKGPIRYSDLVVGEKVDARLRDKNIFNPNFEDDWSNVAVIERSLANICAWYGEPIRVLDVLAPQEIITSPAGEIIIDFGQVIAGRCQMRASGEAGTEVQLSYGEVLDEDGNFYFNNGGPIAGAVDKFILSGTGEDVFKAEFSYRGFRYVKVENYPGEISKTSFQAEKLGTDIEQIIGLSTDNPEINQLIKNILETHKANAFSVLTDNPDRERAGWTGDFGALASTVLRTLNFRSLATRWMRIVKSEQLEDGAIAQVIPKITGFLEEALFAWGDACILLPWEAYQVYGDERILEENYLVAKNWMRWCEARAIESRTPEDVSNPFLSHIWRDKTFGFGDWIVPSKYKLNALGVVIAGSGVTTMIPTMYWANSSSLMASMAHLLNKPDDAAFFEMQHEAIKQSFIEAFITDEGILIEEMQGNYVLALQFDLVPEELRERFFNRLVQLIGEENPVLDTGFLSTPFLLPLLTRFGRPDLAYKIILGKKNPSWLYQVERGATSVWELWDAIAEDGKRSHMSFTQPGLTSVANWMIVNMAGICQGEPGHKKIIFQPTFGNGLNQVSANLESSFGAIGISWKRSGRQVDIDLEVPPNSKGTLVIPAARILGSGLENESNEVRVELESGKYSFKATLGQDWRIAD